ncbi:hypothetical protein XELAEV_18028194mg [Xenopus laevis]|uniref:Uncharacterized protein n=1 Tax=Xenopus laevis TaxID=8355 RepID=A0A974CZ69_XENLA|nr:hypothetical protein XELAEV_18028194mg [Xenopus laevis]
MIFIKLKIPHYRSHERALTVIVGFLWPFQYRNQGLDSDHIQFFTGNSQSSGSFFQADLHCCYLSRVYTANFFIDQ